MAMWNTYIWVDSADETAAKVVEAGGKALMEPFDVMDAGRMAVFADPEGAAFCVWQAKQHKGARVVNEHGSLNFNGLNTRDAERREGVLRRGVRLGDCSTSAAGVQMWTLPGYGDHLERADPGPAQADGRDGRARGASRTSSRPSARSRPTSPTSPAHWSVTFGVDDADATAAKATELGGRWSSRRSTRRGCG